MTESMVLLPTAPHTALLRSFPTPTPLQPQVVHAVDTMAGALQVAGGRDVLYLETPQEGFPCRGQVGSPRDHRTPQLQGMCGWGQSRRTPRQLGGRPCPHHAEPPALQSWSRERSDKPLLLLVAQGYGILPRLTDTHRSRWEVKPTLLSLSESTK